MLKKLYECDCFDYRKYIIDNQKSLALNSDEAIVLINMLQAYKDNNAIKSSELAKISGLTKSKCEKALNSLFERSFYEIKLVTENDISKEVISLDNFFDKVSLQLNNKIDNLEDELSIVIKFLEEKINRVLTSNELEIVDSLVVEDRYKLKDFKASVEVLEERSSNINIKSIAQVIVNHDLINKQSSSKEPSILTDFFKKIK